MLSAQFCTMRPYGELIDSDEFGATIIASKGTSNTKDSQRAIIRLSNVEVRR